MMQSGMKRLIPFWLLPDWRTILSGALIVAAFPPWNLSFLIWIALIPWFAALQRTSSWKHSIVQGFWLSLSLSLGGYYWIAYVLHQFGGLPWSIAVFGPILYGLICQPLLYLVAPIQRSVHRAVLTHPENSPLPGPIALGVALGSALLYSGLDWVVPKLFPDTLGHALHGSPILRQAADIGGAHLLTFLIFLVNDALWLLGRRFRLYLVTQPEGIRGAFRLTLKQTWAPVCAALLLLATTFGYGVFRGQQIRSLQGGSAPVVHFGVIQANIGDFDKVAAEQGASGAAERIIGTYFQLSDQALAMTPKPDVLVWPETAYPSTFRTPQTITDLLNDREVERYVNEREVPLLFGGYDTKNTKDYNAFFFLKPASWNTVPLGGDAPHPENTAIQIYRKHMLLLFGEYIPGAEMFPIIKDLFPQVGHFGRGVGPETLEIPRKAGNSAPFVNPIICYEALFPNYVIEGVRKGSQVILNITNDSWFGPRGEPDLHLALVAFRSIETRRPQLRSTNTGISALILPDGTVTDPTPVYQPAIRNYAVPLLPPVATLMLAWGDWFGPAAFALGLGLLLTLWLRKLKSV